MALNSIVEQWATKRAQIDKKTLEIEQLQLSAILAAVLGVG